MKWFAHINENKIIEWRHWLHQHPEPSFHEYETSAFIENELAKMKGIETVRPTETSVLATIKGNRPGKTICLRADIDALPIQEEADVPFRSETPGVMHACGHDTHAAMLLGAAEALSKMDNDFSGTIKMIFQHAEEVTPGGAKAILETGLLDDVDCFYGSHIMAPMPAGKVFTVSGPTMAAQNSFHLTIRGRGGHGSRPESCIDPISVGAAIIMNMNQIVSRNVGPFQNVVISYGKFESGDIFNVIPDTAWMEGTVRTNTKEDRVFIEKRIREVIDSTCKAFGAAYELKYVHGYPALINDDACTRLAERVAKELFEQDTWQPGTRAMGSEDFAYYLEQKPGTFVFLGGGDESDGCGYGNHHPKFTVLDETLIKGTKMYIGYALTYLSDGV